MTPLVCFSVVDAAKMLCVSKSTIYQLISDNELKPMKIGRRTVVPLRSLEAFVERAMGGPDARTLLSA